MYIIDAIIVIVYALCIIVDSTLISMAIPRSGWILSILRMKKIVLIVLNLLIVLLVLACKLPRNRPRLVCSETEGGRRAVHQSGSQKLLG